MGVDPPSSPKSSFQGGQQAECLHYECCYVHLPELVCTSEQCHLIKTIIYVMLKFWKDLMTGKFIGSKNVHDRILFCTFIRGGSRQ